MADLYVCSHGQTKPCGECAAAYSSTQPAEDERVKEDVRSIVEQIAKTYCWDKDVAKIGGPDKCNWCPACKAKRVLGMLPAQQEDDGWVTFGRIKTDIESETETFERIPVQPAASTPTERATLDALVQMHHAREHRQFNASTCPAWPCDVVRGSRAAAASTGAQDEK